MPQYADPVANAVAALAAGNDMVLTVVYSTPDTATRIIDGIVAAVESGALPADRLEEAAIRVIELRLAVAEAGARRPAVHDLRPRGVTQPAATPSSRSRIARPRSANVRWART